MQERRIGRGEERKTYGERARRHSTRGKRGKLWASRGEEVAFILGREKNSNFFNGRRGKRGQVTFPKKKKGESRRQSCLHTRKVSNWEKRGRGAGGQLTNHKAEWKRGKKMSL